MTDHSHDAQPAKKAPSHYGKQPQAPDSPDEQAKNSHAAAEQPNPSDVHGQAAHARADDPVVDYPVRQTAVHAQPPLDFTGMKLTKPKTVAGGVPAVASALRHVFGAMNVVRGNRALLNLNQKGGHDCPSCAWPDPDDERSPVAEYCENGAKAISDEATTRRVTPVYFQRYSVEDLSDKSDYYLGQQGRLTEPMILRPGQTHYEKISWDEAFRTIAHELNALDTPDEAVFYTSGRTSNEAAFLYQLFVREYGTNNLPDCSNMCHESSGVALSETVGIGKGSVKLEDFYEAEVIIITGQNPGTNHPRMLSALQKAKKNGAKIIAINPLPETGLMAFKHPQDPLDMLSKGTSLTDLFLQVKINGDVALIKAILRLLLDEEDRRPGTVFDHDFIRDKTQGFDDFLTDLRHYDAEALARDSGVPIGQVIAAAQMLADKRKIIICWAMGLTQHRNAVKNIRELVNLLLAKGSIGKPGAGTCPVRGHSNVQGDRTMGIWERPKPAFLDNLQRVFGFEPPREHGYDVVDAIRAMADGRAKVFFAMGGNFLSATPDTEYTAAALEQCRLTVHVSTKLNRSHLIHGQTAIILPCLGRTDVDIQASGQQFVSVENSMGVVHSSQGNLSPISEHLRSEPAIVAGLAKAVLGDRTRIDWDYLVANYDHIRDAIEKVIPGFEQFNERVRVPGGFYLPNGSRVGDFSATKTGKANFTLNEPPVHNLRPDELMMMTIRSHDQFNTTIYGLNDRYRGIFNERRVMMMNPADIEAFGFRPGQVVDLFNYTGGKERVARRFIIVAYDIPRQCVATYFPEANVLVPVNSVAEKSNTPVSKLVVIEVKPAASPAADAPVQARAATMA